MREAATSRRFPVRLVVLLGALALLGTAFALVDLSPDLGHLDVRVLSGPEQGNYYSMVGDWSKVASRDGGSLTNETSRGTVDNLQKLAAASERCEHHFALVQDGVAPPAGAPLELIARLRKSESMFVVGVGASGLQRFAQLRGKSIGVGPVGSGTNHLARVVFEAPVFAELGMRLSNHSLDEQLSMVRSGALDLAVFVLDEDAELIRDAVVGGLELADFQHWDVVARRHDFLWHGRVGAGQYDPIRVRPPSDVRVLRVDTLVVGNGCASNTETVGLLTLLAAQFPGFVDHNRSRGRSHLYQSSTTVEHFFESGGPGLLEQHVPWLVNIMAPSNWVYVVMCISVILNLMTFWHRFRLWRLDANRDKADELIREILGATLTAKEIQELSPSPDHCNQGVLDKLGLAIYSYADLRAKCLKQANSMLVPMGQEGSYRYQEDQIDDMLAAARAYRDRIEEAMT